MLAPPLGPRAVLIRIVLRTKKKKKKKDADTAKKHLVGATPHKIKGPPKVKHKIEMLTEDILASKGFGKLK